jgi:hypothetical protein
MGMGPEHVRRLIQSVYETMKWLSCLIDNPRSEREGSSAND